MQRLTNWAGNVTFGARRVHRPGSVPELQQIVAGSDRLRVLGTGHSFNRIADTTGDLVTVAGLPPVVRIDPDRPRVTISAGLRYGELVARLHAAGYAVPNLGSLPHISVAGACATGTHGSGDRNGVLATAVSALELVTADGALVPVSRAGRPDEFAGLVVGLGGFGVVTALTLDLVPAFDVRQYVYEGLPYARLSADAAEIFAAGYSVSLFTDFTGPRFNQVWIKRRVEADDTWAAPARWFDATPADGPRHPVPGMPPANCTEQGGVAGPWHARLPHFRAEFTPSRGAELQSEYFVAREHAAPALAALDRMRDRIAPPLHVAEIRTVAADDLWLSPAYRRDAVAFHFTWVDDIAAVTPVLSELEHRLDPFDARPHWGKVFTTDPRVLAGRYPRFADAAQLLRRYDPQGRFRNDFLDRHIPAGG